MNTFENLSNSIVAIFISDEKFDLETDIMVLLNKMMAFYGCIFCFIHLMCHMFYQMNTEGSVASFYFL